METKKNKLIQSFKNIVFPNTSKKKQGNKGMKYDIGKKCLLSTVQLKHSLSNKETQIFCYFPSPQESDFNKFTTKFCYTAGCIPSFIETVFPEKKSIYIFNYLEGGNRESIY